MFSRSTPAQLKPLPTFDSQGGERLGVRDCNGPEILRNLPTVRGLPPHRFAEAANKKANVLIDTRLMLAFGGGHIKGALNIGGLPMLSIWAGWLLDPIKSLLLVLDSDGKLDEIVRYFIRPGYTTVAGYLVGGMKAWNNAGRPLGAVGQMTAHEIERAGRTLQVVDVRSSEEWTAGHIPNARHLFLGEFREGLKVLDKGKPTAAYCDSGYRASIATSILQQEGFRSVSNVPGSWQAWKAAGFPVEGATENKKGKK